MDSFRSYWHLAFLVSFLAPLGAGIFLGLVRFKTGHIGYLALGWLAVASLMHYFLYVRRVVVS